MSPRRIGRYVPSPTAAMTSDSASTPSSPPTYDRVYGELRQIAERHLRGERDNHTLTPTALVHEAYLALYGRGEGSAGRGLFYASAARAMRQILVDYARRRNAAKRGGGAQRVTLDDGGLRVDAEAAALLDLDRALDQLARRDARMGQVVECRVFGGLTNEETADAVGVSVATVDRDWSRARAFLHEVLEAA